MDSIELQNSDDAVKMYKRELALIQPLTKDEEAELFQQLRNREQYELAARRLIESKLPLVMSVAERHSPAGLRILDLVQEGNLGLFTALKTFAESGSDDFSAYATVCIEDAISKAIAASK